MEDDEPYVPMTTGILPEDRLRAFRLKVDNYVSEMDSNDQRDIEDPHTAAIYASTIHRNLLESMA